MTIDKPSPISLADWQKTPLAVQTYISNIEQTLEELQAQVEAQSHTHLREERRLVTVLFADLSGFTALNDAAKSPADAERVIGLVNYLLQELSEAIYEFDGYIDKYIGDEIMAIFGAPKAHHNDPELALRAALSMMERLERFNANPPLPLAKPLGVHMGINTGTVIAGMVGSKRQRSYTVMGDAVNVAARLESVSVRGQIFVSEATYNLTHRLFVFDERDPVSVKGKAEPLKVYELLAARERPLPGSDGQAPFTGRQEEMTILGKLYRRLAEGRGSIVIISSDAGMGKSRLIQEFRTSIGEDAEANFGLPLWLQGRAQAGDDAADEQSPLWLFGRGLSYRRSFANRLFVDILYSYLGVSSNAEPSLVKMRLEAMTDDLFAGRRDEVLPYLATLLGLTLDATVAENLPLNDPQVLQQRTFLAVGEWVEALAMRQPVVLVFEDLHWADPSSVNLIEYLFTMAKFIPLMLICATRFDRQATFWQVRNKIIDERESDITELPLWPLTDHEGRQLITQMLKIDELPRDMEQVLLRRAEGNPLFLEEVLRGLIEQEVIQYQSGQWRITRDITDMDVPDTLQGVFRERLDRLDDDVKRVLQTAAVIGRVFPQFILKPMVDDPSILDRAIEELQTADLIKVVTDEDEPEYMFKHMITYEIAYNTMLLGQRQAMHKRIADHMARLYFLIGEQFAEHVAEHYSKSEVWDRAFKYLRRAAEAAAQSFFNREAVEFYTRALEIVPKIPAERFNQVELIDLHRGRAAILARLGEAQNAIKDYEAMLQQAKSLGDDHAELQSLNGIGTLHANSDFSSAAELFQKALQVARRIGDQKGIADTLNRLGEFYYNLGELDKATNYYNEAHSISVTVEADTSRIEAEDGLTVISLEKGNTSLAIQHYVDNIIPARRRLAYRGGLLRSLSNLLRAQVSTGNYQAADEILEEVEQLYQKSGDSYLAPLMNYHQALGQLYRGQFKGAHENLLEGLTIAKKQQQRGWQVMGKMWLCYHYLILGLNDLCLMEAKQSSQMALELGSPLYILRAQWILAASQRRLGNVTQAINDLENVANVARKMEFNLDRVLILYQLGRAYYESEQWEEATQTINDLFSLAHRSQAREFIMRAELLQAMIAVRQERYQTALNMLMQTATYAESRQSKLALYLVKAQQAALYHHFGDQSNTHQTLETAYQLQQMMIQPLSAEHQQAFLENDHAQQLIILLQQTDFKPTLLSEPVARASAAS